EIFSCEKGKGAWLGTRQLHGSPARALSRRGVGTGTPHPGRPHPAPYLAALAAIMSGVAGVRRLGSAALDLAYVAAGRFDAFFELGLAPWDVAAGTLLVREAGGIVTGVDGRPVGIDSGEILAASCEPLHRTIVGCLTQLHGVQDVRRIGCQTAEEVTAMYIAYTPEQETLRAELRAYFAELMTPEVEAEVERGDTGGPHCLEAVRKMGRDGWLGIGWPTEYGGQGRS